MDVIVVVHGYSHAIMGRKMSVQGWMDSRDTRIGTVGKMTVVGLAAAGKSGGISPLGKPNIKIFAKLVVECLHSLQHCLLPCTMHITLLT